MSKILVPGTFPNDILNGCIVPPLLFSLKNHQLATIIKTFREGVKAMARIVPIAVFIATVAISAVGCKDPADTGGGGGFIDVNGDGFDDNTHKNADGGYYINGYDWEGYNENGLHRDTHKNRTGGVYGLNDRDWGGYDNKRFLADGTHENGTLYDGDGYDWKGFDSDGYNERGFGSDKRHKDTGEEWDENGNDWQGDYYIDKCGYDYQDKKDGVYRFGDVVKALEEMGTINAHIDAKPFEPGEDQMRASYVLWQNREAFVRHFRGVNKIFSDNCPDSTLKDAVSGGLGELSAVNSNAYDGGYFNNGENVVSAGIEATAHYILTIIDKLGGNTTEANKFKKILTAYRADAYLDFRECGTEQATEDQLTATGYSRNDIENVVNAYIPELAKSLNIDHPGLIKILFDQVKMLEQLYACIDDIKTEGYHTTESGQYVTPTIVATRPIQIEALTDAVKLRLSNSTNIEQVQER